MGGFKLFCHSLCLNLEFLGFLGTFWANEGAITGATQGAHHFVGVGAVGTTVGVKVL